MYRPTSEAEAKQHPHVGYLPTPILVLSAPIFKILCQPSNKAKNLHGGETTELTFNMRIPSTIKHVQNSSDHIQTHKLLTDTSKQAAKLQLIKC